ncbi:Choline-sulfatase [Pirellulimonas nuda]|uniref:Choline-sulfatase n=1 Tax=Pirellulimonas nuda TaxID=2528009 RepID=A0A518DJ04_9BACT|nr:sulfatase/phosphatase domain-containing protein [Pirellulimonas nuda]QDU91450.1 Choline-sulfatase [Pirellulimonas nuda]
MLDNTLIIFTSDNGGWQSSHNWDRNIETRTGQTVDLRGAKEGYYEGGLRTPMIAYWPGRIAPGSETELPVAFYDYMPTFAALAGIESALPPSVDGVSFAPTLTGQGVQTQRTGLYFEGYAYNPNSAPTQIARIGDWKMIRDGDGSVQLFDLATDPSETTNRAANPAAAGVRDQLLGYITANHTPIQTHLSVLPPNVGTGNANRDGFMPFGLRPAGQAREWTLAESGDARSLVGIVRDETNQTIAVHLDDLHMVYTVELTLKASAALTSELSVELVGESGFTYFHGAFDPESLVIGSPTTVEVALTQVGLSPSTGELASDLGGALALEVSHGGAQNTLIAHSVVLRGVAPTLTAPPLVGELNDDGRNDEVHFAIFKQVCDGLNGANAFAEIATIFPAPSLSVTVISTLLDLAEVHR